MTSYPVLEHGGSRTGRWLRARRLRIALLIAVVETALILTDVIGWFPALGVAAFVFAFYFFVGRKARFESIRQLSWAAAVSQTLPVLIPLIAGIVLFLAIVALAVIALTLLVMLYLDRKR